MCRDRRTRNQSIYNGFYEVHCCWYDYKNNNFILTYTLMSAARLITGVGRNDHITPIIARHTQLVAYVLAHYLQKCADDTRLYPWSITNACLRTSRSRRLPLPALLCRPRGNDRIPRTRTGRCGPRSFRVVAPQIWNMFPSHRKDRNIRREPGFLCKPILVGGTS